MTVVPSGVSAGGNFWCLVCTGHMCTWDLWFSWVKPKQANIICIPQFALQLSGLSRNLESAGCTSGFAWCIFLGQWWVVWSVLSPEQRPFRPWGWEAQAWPVKGNQQVQYPLALSKWQNSCWPAAGQPCCGVLALLLHVSPLVMLVAFLIVSASVRRSCLRLSCSGWSFLDQSSCAAADSFNASSCTGPSAVKKALISQGFLFSLWPLLCYQRFF